MTLVNISIQNPLIDQLNFRALKYKAIKRKKAKKLKIPSNTIIGYSIGCLDTSPYETIANQRKTHTSPAAPTADNPNESAVVLILQLFFTVLENIKQNKAETINVTPNKIATNDQPFIIRKTRNSYVGASAPPIMPIAPF